MQTRAVLHAVKSLVDELFLVLLVAAVCAGGCAGRVRAVACLTTCPPACCDASRTRADCSLPTVAALRCLCVSTQTAGVHLRQQCSSNYHHTRADHLTKTKVLGGSRATSGSGAVPRQPIVTITSPMDCCAMNCPLPNLSHHVVQLLLLAARLHSGDVCSRMSSDNHRGKTENPQNCLQRARHQYHSNCQNDHTCVLLRPYNTAQRGGSTRQSEGKGHESG